MNYYFISIGGSGAKVLESVVHFCMAGIMPSGKISVFAIDPDNTNGNLARSGKVLEEYRQMENFNVGLDTPLFSTKVELLQPFPWSPVSINQTLSGLIKFNTVTAPAGKLYTALYTKQERDTSLNQGFRGHPAIGAAAFAQQFNQNADWRRFLNDITQAAGQGQSIKIFLAGSVFGGTGASGIPTIARLLKSSIAPNLQSNLSIGGALILPYFDFVENNTNQGLFARSKNFLMNTKAAITYYSQRDNVFDSIYFIGDAISRREEFSIGADSQKNNAHLVDFYAALAAADFFHNQNHNPNPQTVNTFNTIYHNNNQTFSWSDFPTQINDFNFSARFVRYARFIFAYVYWIKPHISGLADGQIDAKNHAWYSKLVDKNNRPPQNIKADAQNFANYTESFIDWLNQLENIDNRSVELIKPSVFTAASEYKIDPDDFSSCGYTDDKLTLGAINDKICADGRGMLQRVRGLFGGTKKNSLDFGQFLRQLYDACKVKN